MNMKNMIKIMVLGALVACSVPALAQQDNAWSTGGVAGSGSAYSSQVTPVGATAPNEMATTTYSGQSSNARRSKARREGQDGRDPGDVTEASTEYSIGSALALLAFAAVGTGVVLKRRREDRKEVHNA